MPVPNNKASVQNKPKSYPTIPEDVYTVQIVDVEFHEGVEGKYSKKDKFYFRLGFLEDVEFEHVNEEGETEELSTRGMSVIHFTTTAYSAGSNGYSNSKLYDLACAVYGEKLDDTKELDVNSLIGGRFRVTIKHSESDDGKIYFNVDSVMKENKTSEKLKDLTNKEIEEIMPKDDKNAEPEDIDIDELIEEIDGELPKATEE